MPEKPPAKTAPKPAKAAEKPVKTVRAAGKPTEKTAIAAPKTAKKPAKAATKTTAKAPAKPKKPAKAIEPDIETKLEKAPRQASEEAELEARVRAVCALLSAKKAESIKVVHVEKITSLADYFIICSGRNIQQAKAIYDNLTEKCEEIGAQLRRSEGEKEGRWIAVDLGEIIVHIFNAEAREFYQLDKLWSNGTNIYEYTD